MRIQDELRKPIKHPYLAAILILPIVIWLMVIGVIGAIGIVLTMLGLSLVYVSTHLLDSLLFVMAMLMDHKTGDQNNGEE